jgi:hypothetical protein
MLRIAIIGAGLIGRSCESQRELFLTLTQRQPAPYRLDHFILTPTASAASVTSQSDQRRPCAG